MQSGDREKGSAAGFDALQREYWEWQLREIPELSTWTEDNRYNDRFTDLSFEAIYRRNADERRMLDEVRSIDPSRLFRRDTLW